MEVRIERVNKGEYGVFLDVCINDEFIVYGCKIVNSNGGKFISMPSRKGNDGKYYTHCRFRDRAKQDEFSHLVISAYEGNSGSNEAKKEQKVTSPDEINWTE